MRAIYTIALLTVPVIIGLTIAQLLHIAALNMLLGK